MYLVITTDFDHLDDNQIVHWHRLIVERSVRSRVSISVQLSLYSRFIPDELSFKLFVLLRMLLLVELESARAQLLSGWYEAFVREL